VRCARLGVACVAAIATAALSRSAAAHSFDPGVLDVRESDRGVYDVRWRPPLALALAGVGREAEPRFPDRCRRLPSDSTATPADSAVDSFRLDCGEAGLAGARLSLPGLEENPSDALVRIRWLSGEVSAATLVAGSAVLEVRAPSERSTSAVAEDAVARLLSAIAQGVQQVARRPDNLLFVAALLLLVDGLASLVKTLAAFVLAQSLTLALVAAGIASLAPAPTQALIAASIVLLAAEAARPAEQKHLAGTAPWLAAAALGLLHGFAFADGLAAVAPSATGSALPALAFHLGVEAGELSLAAVLALAFAALRRMLPRRPWAHLVPAYALGGVAAAWTIERVIRCFMPPL
jgi:HupE / UreJ protein